MYGKGKRSIGETKTPQGSCKIEANANGVVEYASCDAKNGAGEFWDDDQSVVKAKKTACDWLNTQGAKTSKQVDKEYKKRSKAVAGNAVNWPMVGGLVVAVGGMGLLAYKLVQK